MVTFKPVTLARTLRSNLPHTVHAIGPPALATGHWRFSSRYAKTTRLFVYRCDQQTVSCS